MKSSKCAKYASIKVASHFFPQLSVQSVYQESNVIFPGWNQWFELTRTVFWPGLKYRLGLDYMPGRTLLACHHCSDKYDYESEHQHLLIIYKKYTIPQKIISFLHFCLKTSHALITDILLMIDQ